MRKSKVNSRQWWWRWWLWFWKRFSLWHLKNSLQQHIFTNEKTKKENSDSWPENKNKLPPPFQDDFRSLFSANEKLRTEYKSLQGDYKSIKTENNTVKLKLTELNGELNEARDQMAALDVEVSKLTNKCQVRRRHCLALPLFVAAEKMMR